MNKKWVRTKPNILDLNYNENKTYTNNQIDAENV